MVVSLKNNLLWNKFKAIYPFVGGTSTPHKYNLINNRTFDLTNFVGSWVHGSLGARATSFVSGNYNGYADTNISPLTNFNANGSDVSFWFYGNGETNQDQYIAIGTYFLTLNVPYKNPNYTALNGNAGSGISTIDSSYTKGLFGASRLANDNDWRYYNYRIGGGYTDGLMFTNTKAYQIPTAQTIYLASAHNQTGVDAQYGTSEWCSFAGIAIGLTTAEAVTLNTIVSAYQTALSRN